MHESFVDFNNKSYEYSFSDGEVDDPQEFLSDEDVPSEPAQECARLAWLNTTENLGRAALKVKSQSFVHAAVQFSKTVQSLFSFCSWVEDITKCQIMSNESLYWRTFIVHYGSRLLS